MNINYKKFGVVFGSVLGGIYLLFLMLPIVLTPIANSYTDKINEIVRESTGLNTKIEGIGVVTTPKLSAGLKIKNLELSVPNETLPTIKSENFKIKLSLIPLVIGRIRLDSITLDKITANISVKKDGSFVFMDYLPKDDDGDKTQTGFSIPFGFKLSDRLPNVGIKNYKIGFLDSVSNKSYYTEGQNFKISDFVFNKSVKVLAQGKVVFDARTVSNYDIKIKNFIMPEDHLNDVLAQNSVFEDVGDSDVKSSNSSQVINVIDIFNLVNKNLLKGDVDSDITISGSVKNPDIKGALSLNALSVGVNGKPLPDSSIRMNFKGNNSSISSTIYSSFDKSEKTDISGTFKTGKNPNINLTFKSNAEFNNIIRLIDSIAQSFGKNDFKTITATGGIDADFNLKSNLKKVLSNGYLKVKPSSLKYGLYNVEVNNIVADVNLANNNINISNAGFSVYGQPLRLSGLISSNSDADLKLTADKLNLKGLIAAAGQNAILKDNVFNSGTLSLNTLIKGKLNKLRPDVSLSCDNVNVYNVPSSTRLLLDNSIIKLVQENESISGNILVHSLGIKNSSVSVTLPKSEIVMTPKDINIKNAYLLMGNSRIDLTGSINDYANKMNINLDASGQLSSLAVSGFLPKEVKSMFPVKGAMPVSVKISGDKKSQNIKFDLTADSVNYVRFADVNLLKGKTTKIHSDMNISGDKLTLSNTQLSTGGNSIATATGGISKLYSSPKLGVDIHVPQNVSFPIWGLNNSNITVHGDISILGDITNPKFKGVANISDISVKDMDFALSNLVANLDGTGIAGNATAEKFKFGGIVANDISGRFSLKDYKIFYLDDLSGKAFSGIVNGKLSYNIPTTGISLSMKGEGLNSEDAVYGAVGIKKALTGIMGFNTNLTMRGVTEKEIIQSTKGDIDFDIQDGRFVSIGKLENLVSAQNVTSYSILKAAISKLSTFSAIQESDKFKSIFGKLTLQNGVANISKIDVSGPLMSYHVSGRYNILPNTASLVVLGRLESKVVSCLGVLGDLSAEKLLSYIPSIGAATANYLNILTTNPEQENVSLIPALSNGSTAYKDFKVIINGTLGAVNSVKSFKWLSKCDTSKMNIKDDVQNAINSVKSDLNKQITTTKNDIESAKNVVNKAIETHKQNYQTQRQNVQQTINDMKNIKQDATQSVQNIKDLFKNAAKNSVTKPASQSSAPVQSAE